MMNRKAPSRATTDRAHWLDAELALSEQALHRVRTALATDHLTAAVRDATLDRLQSAQLALLACETAPPA